MSRLSTYLILLIFYTTKQIITSCNIHTTVFQVKRLNNRT